MPFTAGFGLLDILVLVGIILVIVFIVLYFLNKWAGTRMADQQDMVERHKQPATIYVIDKKKDKLTNANLPKAMASQVPRMGRLMKMPLVKAKIGPQIMTLVCDKDVYNALPVKKSVNVELAGAYIVSMKGMKTKQQLAEQRKSRRQTSGEDAPLRWHERILSKIKR